MSRLELIDEITVLMLAGWDVLALVSYLSSKMVFIFISLFLTDVVVVAIK